MSSTITQPRTLRINAGPMTGILVLQVLPGGTLRIRESGSRTWFPIALARVFRIAIEDEAAAARVERSHRKRGSLL